MVARIIAIVGVLVIFYIISVLLTVFKKPIRQWAMNMNARLKIQSLKKAVRQADEIKAKTGRKAIVVFNKTNNEYEAIEKKLLKRAANNSKGKPDRVFTHERVKHIQQKSLYVTRS